MTDVKTKAALDRIILEQQHLSYIFPEDTDLTVTFTAAAANIWSAWAEIQDDGVPTTFSSKFAAQRGHISLVMVEDCSVKDKVYMLEIAYGADKKIISPHRFISGTAPKEPSIQEARVRSPVIPAGETVYYRMKCEQAGPQTAELSFRYHYHK